MIKVLIVDDESSTRKGLIKHIKWSKLGVEFVEGAKNGLEGLELARRIEPDIVISDIRMPKMGGIEFSEQIRELFPECKLIFLSGYSDKHYLKSAIQLSALSYVEKPINIEEFKSVLKRAIKLYMENEEKKKAEEEIKSAFFESIPFIKQNIIQSFVVKEKVSEETKKQIKLARVPFEECDSYRVSIISLLYNDGQSKKIKQAYCNEIISFIEKNSEDLNNIATIKEFDQILVISSNKVEVKRSVLSSICESLIKYINKNIPECINFFWAVGQEVSGMSVIKDSFETSSIALEKLFFLGYGAMHFYNREENTKCTLNSDNILSEFTKLLKSFQKDSLTDFIENFCINIESNIKTDVYEIKNLFFQMTLLLFKEGEARGLQIKKTQDNEDKYWLKISKFQTIQDLKKYFLTKIEQIIQGVENNGSNNKVVLKVMDYVNENYSNSNLTIEILADNIYLTPTYLSYLFKKETGKTISEYLAEVRIDESLTWLMDPQYKLYEIAEKAGYNDSNYYTKKFKKLKGMTPSEFRRTYKTW